MLAYEFEELTVYQRDKELFLEVLDVTDNDTGLVMRPLELSSDSEESGKKRISSFHTKSVLPFQPGFPAK